jgi:hypothetical protein
MMNKALYFGLKILCSSWEADYTADDNITTPRYDLADIIMNFDLVDTYQKYSTRASQGIFAQNILYMNEALEISYPDKSVEDEASPAKYDPRILFDKSYIEELRKLKNVKAGCIGAA